MDLSKPVAYVLFLHLLAAGVLFAQSDPPYDLGQLPSVVSGLQWPSPPVTNTVENVSTMSGLQAAVARSNVLVNVAAGTYTGNVTVSGSDVDVVCSNAATISGRLTFDGVRHRWTGGVMDVGPLSTNGGSDLLINNLHAVTHTSQEQGAANNFTGGAGGIDRLAIINSTLRVITSTCHDCWAWFCMPKGNTDVILANVRLESEGQNNRFQGINGLVIKDCYFNSENRSTNGLRIHSACDGVWISNLIFVGLASGATSSLNARNVVVEGSNNYFDGNSNQAWFSLKTALVNGTINDSPCYTTSSSSYGGEMSLGDFTGSNNIVHQWDGVTLPSADSYGADHGPDVPVERTTVRSRPPVYHLATTRAYTLDGRLMTGAARALSRKSHRLPHGLYVVQYLDEEGQRLHSEPSRRLCLQ